MKKFLVLMLFSMNFLLFGCQSEENNHSSIHKTPNGDIRERTASVEELPSFLSDKHENIVTIYKAASKHEQLLRSIPCYCGCAQSANHRDNFECFVHEIKDNGEVVWDDHGTKCNICLEIAAKSIVEYEKGKSILEIRNLIDEQYKNGYPEPTPTPMPKA